MTPAHVRCCCGKVMLPEGDPGLILNDYGHEPLGPEGNFCGPTYKHELRDLRAALARAEKLTAEWERESTGYYTKAKRYARDLRAALRGQP